MGTFLFSLLGGTAGLVAVSACSDKGGGLDGESTEPTNLRGLDRSTIRDILPGADIVRELSIVPVSEDQRRVQFRALGRAFTLRLARNYELFAPDLVVVRDGVRMLAREAGVLPPFRGYVEGDPSSWVRVNIRNDLVEGIVFTQDDLFEIRPNVEDPTSSTMARGAIADYMENPTGAGDAHCGVIGEGAAAPSTPETPVAPQQCTWIGVHQISDYTHCAKVGNTSASCEAEMTTRMNEIDGIYRADIQKGFRVEMLTTHTTSGRPRLQRSRTQHQCSPRRTIGLEVAERRSARLGSAQLGPRDVRRCGTRLGGRPLLEEQRQQRVQLPRHRPRHDHLRGPRNGAQLRLRPRRVGRGVHHGPVRQRQRDRHFRRPANRRSLRTSIA